MDSIIYKHLAELEPGEYRKKEAIRLLKLFRHNGKNPLPQGYSTTYEHTEIKSIESQRRFFKDLADLLGDDTPEDLEEMRERYERNLQQMKKLTAMKAHERNSLPIHETFPFYDDFEYHTPSEGVYFWDSDARNIIFKPDFIAKGAFASIYRVENDEGRPYALKLFRPTSQIVQNKRKRFKILVRYIFHNVKERRELFSEEPFTPVRASTSYPENTPWYLMDYFDGESVKKKMDMKQDVTQDRDMTRRIITGYAKMLKKLHSKGLLFMDHSWDSVLVNQMRIGICDFDLTIAEDDPNIKETLAAHLAYRSRELQTWNPPTRQSELESFALMIDHLFFGKPILQEHNINYHRELAVSNRRTHHRARRQSLPPNLQQVVTPLINLPRDETITIDDFIEAAGLDLA